MKVPKSWVPFLTEVWVWADLKVPVEGSLASYRFGRYHVHDMGDHFLLHKDWYDPAVSPIKHIFADIRKYTATAIVAGIVGFGIYLVYYLINHSKEKKPEFMKNFVKYSCMYITSVFILVMYIIWISIVRYNQDREPTKKRMGKRWRVLENKKTDSFIDN